MNNTIKISQDLRFKCIVLLGLFIAAYWVPLKAMVTIWLTNDDYSYGFLIPLISVYFLWEKRKSISDVVFKSSWAALPLLLLFYLICLYGTLGSSGSASITAIPFLIALYTAFCFGIPLVKRLALPLGFLIFMVPLPTIVDTTLGVFLKSVSSKMGGWIIQAVGIPVYVSGNIIDIGTTQLQVVDACSGMRYLFALLALGVIYAATFQKVLWKRILCFLVTIPIAIFTNALRIGATGILANHYGSGVAEGFFHGFSGWIIFMFAFALLFLFGLFLKFLFPDPTSDTKPTKHNVSLPEVATAIGGGINRAFYTSIILICIFGLFSLSTHTMPPIKIQGGIVSFPLNFSNWQGRSEFVDPEIVEKSGAEESFSGTYSNSKGDIISLYMGFRSTAFLANENFFHSPTVCLPSSGWKVTEEGTKVIDNVPYWGSLTAYRMVIENSGQSQVAYFWFQTKDRTSYNVNINRYHLALHAITRNNTYDLFIRPITPVGHNETIADADRRMDQFVREMMAEMLKFLKEKQIKEKA